MTFILKKVVSYLIIIKYALKIHILCELCNLTNALFLVLCMHDLLLVAYDCRSVYEIILICHIVDILHILVRNRDVQTKSNFGRMLIYTCFRKEAFSAFS